jgi:hypothetical protein
MEGWPKAVRIGLPTKFLALRTSASLNSAHFIVRRLNAKP